MTKEQETNINSGLFANMMLQLFLWMFLFFQMNCRFNTIDKDLKQLKDSVIISEKSPEQLKIEQLEKRLEDLQKEKSNG